jgi:hypothetical protein
MTSKLRQRFTREEAEAKLGQRVRCLVDFSTVLAGSTGRIVAIEETAADLFDLIIEWDEPTSTRPPRDWVRKDQYEQFLIED